MPKSAQRKLDTYLASGLNVIRDYVRPDENRLSDIMTDLLNPDGLHGQGRAFLRIFLERLELENYASKNVEILTREDSARGGRRIDIVLQFKNGHAVALENKPFAGDQENQLHDYSSFLDDKYSGKYVLFYLTPGGISPPAHSIDPLKWECLVGEGRLRAISYQEHIREWLELCVLECKSEKVRWFLRDFVGFVEESFGHQNVDGDEADQNAR